MGENLAYEQLNLTSIDNAEGLREEIIDSIDLRSNFSGNGSYSDFISWCDKTDYEPDDAGAYDAWIEEKREERSCNFADNDDD